MTYNDTKVLSYANTLGLMTGDYVFIVVEGNADYLKENVDQAKSSEVTWIKTEWSLLLINVPSLSDIDRVVFYNLQAVR